MITISEYGTSLFQFVGFCVVFPKKHRPNPYSKGSTQYSRRLQDSCMYIYIYRVYIIVYLRILICRLIWYDLMIKLLCQTTHFSILNLLAGSLTKVCATNASHASYLHGISIQLMLPWLPSHELRASFHALCHTFSVDFILVSSSHQRNKPQNGLLGPTERHVWSGFSEAHGSVSVQQNWAVFAQQSYLMTSFLQGFVGCLAGCLLRCCQASQKLIWTLWHWNSSYFKQKIGGFCYFHQSLSWAVVPISLEMSASQQLMNANPFPTKTTHATRTDDPTQTFLPATCFKVFQFWKNFVIISVSYIGCKKCPLPDVAMVDGKNKIMTMHQETKVHKHLIS